jgi:hypothetical protein
MAKKKPAANTARSKLQTDEEEQLRQMIAARSNIQPELLELLTFKRLHEEELQASAWLRVFGLLASAGFALWRAAFLFRHETGTHETYLNNVERFVKKIISDNNIAFSDDQNTWSLWHYIGGARSSLLEASTLLDVRLNDPKFGLAVSKLVDAPLLQDTAAKQWNELFEIMQLFRRLLGSRIEVHRKMLPNSLFPG